jgi:hypothetical protein
MAGGEDCDDAHESRRVHSGGHRGADASGFFIAQDGTLLVTDSQTNEKTNPGRKRGIFIGNIKDAVATAFIPDPELEKQDNSVISGASGVMVDATGSIYAADVAPHNVRKYVKR